MKKIIILFILSLHLIACGPKVMISPDSVDQLRTITLLPIESSSPVARERLAIIEESLFRSLTAQGFQVFDPESLKKFCLSEQCNDLTKVADFSKSDATVSLLITSNNSTNILAGHYYSIAGIFKMFSAEGKELISIEHSESDSGGLLFNSGQLLQGIKSTSDSLEDDFFPSLADKFSRTISSKLPAPRGNLTTSAIDITNSEIKALGYGRFSICIESPNAETVLLKLADLSYPLRKLREKKFCGAYLIDQQSIGDNHIQAIARNHYGQSKAVLIDNPLKFTCDYDSLITKIDGYIHLANRPECAGVRFSVFSAETETGPFYLNKRAAQLGSKVPISKENSKVISAISTTNRTAKTEQLIFK